MHRALTNGLRILSNRLWHLCQRMHDQPFVIQGRFQAFLSGFSSNRSQTGHRWALFDSCCIMKKLGYIFFLSFHFKIIRRKKAGSSGLTGLLNISMWPHHGSAAGSTCRSFFHFLWAPTTHLGSLHVQVEPLKDSGRARDVSASVTAALSEWIADGVTQGTGLRPAWEFEGRGRRSNRLFSLS
jgi:hypothetical protein